MPPLSDLRLFARIKMAEGLELLWYDQFADLIDGRKF